MKKLVAIIAILFSASFLPGVAASQIQVGGKCLTVGDKTTVNGFQFICVKNGKNLIWKKNVLPSATPAPTQATITFENLFENRAAISYTAWKKTSDLIASSTSKLGDLDINTGPNTKPWFNQLSTALGFVSRAFPNEPEAKKVLIIRYNFQDQDWATNLLKSKISQQEFDRLNRDEGGRLLSSNCEQSGTCRGSKEQTTQDGLAILLIGVPNSVSQDPIRYSTGQLEAHEYFHSIQRVPFVNVNLQSKDWPTRWFLEGSAEWIQNAAVNSQSFSKYQSFLKSDCDPSSSCSGLSESVISDYLSKSHLGNGMSDFDQRYAYSLGSKVCELLSAIAGPEALIQIWNAQATGIGWDAAFQKVYGVDWNSVYPLIAKSLNSNIQNRV